MAISYDARCMARPWNASAIQNGKRKSLGYYASEHDAREAYLDFKAQIFEEVIEPEIPTSYKIEPSKKPVNLAFGTDWKRHDK